MNNQDKPLTSKSGTSSLLRPTFSPGLVLEDDDLNAGVTYTREFTRLMFRSLFGCGVICGLTVSGKQLCASKWQFSVSKGLALDCMGNPIELPSDVSVEYAPDCDGFDPPVWIAVCYSEKCCRPKEVTCSSSSDASPQPTRIRSGYEVKVYSKLPKCACHCPTEDDNPTPPPTDGCCDDADPDGQTGQTTQGTGAAVAAREPEPCLKVCSCFQSHYDGVCECGCNCCCVIVGKITGIPDTTPQGESILLADRTANVDYGMVRYIRPILNGYYKCCTPPQQRQQNG
jgi:hypothetical protein